MELEPTNTIPGYAPPRIDYEPAAPAAPVYFEISGPPECQAKLVAAMAAAQMEFEPIEKTREGRMGNQPFRYAPLGTMTAATLPYLAKHGVIVRQPITNSPRDASKHRLTTIVMGHGAYMSSTLDFAPQQTDQPREDGKTQYRGEWIKEYGKLTTYLRRYMYQAVFMLDAEPDADDGPDQPEPRREVRREAPRPEPRPEPPRAQQPPPRPASAPPPQPELRAVDSSGPADKDTIEQLTALFVQSGLKKVAFNQLCSDTVGMAAEQLRGSQAAAHKMMEKLQEMILDQTARQAQGTA